MSSSLKCKRCIWEGGVTFELWTTYYPLINDSAMCLALLLLLCNYYIQENFPALNITGKDTAKFVRQVHNMQHNIKIEMSLSEHQSGVLGICQGGTIDA